MMNNLKLDTVKMKNKYFSSDFWEKQSKKLPGWLWILVRLIIILGVSYIILFPLFTKLSASVMSQRDLFDPTVRWIPRNFTIEYYFVAFEYMEYPLAFINSFILSFSVSSLQLATCSLVGYGLARYKFRGNGFVFALVIFTLIVPPQMITIPLYLNFRFFDLYGLLPEGGLNLLGTYWPLLLTSITGNGLRNGLFIYIMRQYFKGMPKQLEEAAYVDGAGPLKTFLKVMLPGAIPAIIIVFLFSFVWQWNDYFFTRIFMGDMTLLPVKLDHLAINVLDGDHHMIQGQYASLINNTGMIMFIAPLLILYACLQNYFIESIQRTGITG